MQAMRLGVVNFLNAYPLWAGLEHLPEIQLVPDVPSRLARELRAGNLDAALVSSVEYLRHPAGFNYHPQLCIAATRESRSIRLFVRSSHEEFSAAARSLTRIYTDAASRSSVAQLQVMLRELDLSPGLEEITAVGERIAGLRDSEAVLAIGDTALRHIAEPSYDLQQEYHSLFKRGFVYALWVCRAGSAAALDSILQEAYAQWQSCTPDLLAEAVRRFGFSLAFTTEYLSQVIEYRLTPERQQDLEFFARKLYEI